MNVPLLRKERALHAIRCIIKDVINCIERCAKYENVKQFINKGNNGIGNVTGGNTHS